MKTIKRYKLIKGSGGGNNLNAIGIEINSQTEDSANFVGKCRKKAEELFGTGASLNAVGTTYGVHFRDKDLSKNRKMTRILIKIVELEEQLLKLKNNE